MMSPNPTGSFDPLDGIIAEYLQAVEGGLAPTRESVLARYPDHAEKLRVFFLDFDAVGRDASKFRLPSSNRTSETVTHDKASLVQQPKVQYLGDYELQSEIARGGMGVVYRAKQVSLNRPVAVKMILAGTYATLEAVQRFRAEAEAAANLDHPNILPIYEVGEHEGHQYFSMKLVEGGSLSSKIDELKSKPKQIAELMATLARAVHFAHQRGILHRDLKPANVLMDTDGTPYVTDFGLAKKVDADDGSTRTGSIVGTPSYMAPEQARGEKGLTTSVDVYSLGAILYEMLTGQPPFKGETIFETVKQVMEMEARDPRSINPSADRDLSVIALKCLEKNPERRYATASDLAEDLERYLQDEPIMARPLSLAARSWRWLRKHTGSILVLLCLGTLWGLSCAVWTVGASKGQQERFWPDSLLHPMGLAKWYRTSDFGEYLIIGIGLSLTVLGGWLVVALTRPRDSANAAGLGASLGLLSAVVYFLVLSPFVAVEVKGVFEKYQIHPLSADLSLARKKYVWVGEKMVETQLVAEQQELDYLQQFRTDPPRPEDPKWQESISTDRYFAVRVNQIDTAFKGLWLMALGVITYFLPIGIVSTLTAHHVRQRGLNFWLWRWIAYLEIHLPIGSGLVFFFMYIPMMIFMYLVTDGHFSDAAFALTISILLTLIAFNALQLRAALREWPWWLRLMIFTIWAGSVAIATWTIVNK